MFRELSNLNTCINQAPAKGLVFFDPAVEKVELLLAGLQPGLQGVLLKPDRDGFAQITQVLAKYPAISNLHIVSHGCPGTIHLGNCLITAENLSQWANQLQHWRSLLAEKANIFLYGCQLASGALGITLLKALHHLTGAAIAASPTLVGHSSLGGQWNLSVQVGDINTELAFDAQAIAAYPGTLAVFLDGVNDYVGIPNESSFDITGNFTIEARINVSSFTKSFQAILNKGDTSWRLQRNGATNGLEFATGGGGAPIYYAATTTGINVGQWHHIAGVYNGSQMLLYIDGVLVASGAASGLVATNDFQFAIGEDLQYNRSFHGQIEEVRVWNVARSSTDINNFKNTSVATNSTGLIGYWKLNETSGTTAFDSSSRSIHGSLSNGASWFVPNVAPTVSLPSGSPTYSENAAAIIIDASATVSDSDSPNFDTGILTLSFSTGGTADDRLEIRNQGNGTGLIGVSGSSVTYQGITIGSFTGGVGTTPLVITFNSNATAVSAQALLRNITFRNISEAPSTISRTFRAVLTDGDGGTSSAVTKTIFVTAINDAPAISLPTAGNVAYTENAAAVVIDSSATVSDLDNTTFNTGTLTVSISSGGTTDDRLTIRNQGTGTGLIGISGSNVTYQGITIGTFTGGIGTTALVISLNSSATLAAVQALLSNITFSNVSDAPSTTNRVINFVLTDGAGGTSNSATKTITVAAVNDVPVIALPTAGSVAYTENAAAVVIDGSATVSDPDLGNFNNGTLTVNISSGGTADDRLTIRNQGNSSGLIGINGSNVTYEGVLIGTFAGGIGTTALVITFNSSSSVVAAQALLRNITFSNISDTPSSTNRVLNFVLTDGAGGTSNSPSKTITVAAVNDAPVITLPTVEAVSYTENTTPVLVDGSATVSDVDTTNFNTATLTVSISSGGTADDRLAIQNRDTGVGQIELIGSNITYQETAVAQGLIVATFAGGTGTTPLSITFNSNANAIAIQAVLRSITFSNVSDAPSTASRVLSFVLTDGAGGTSSTVTKAIAVTPVNDAPIIALPTAGSVAYTENAAGVSIDSSATIFDPDLNNFNTGTLTVSISSAGTIDDRLAIQNQGTGTGQIGVSGSNVTYQGVLIGSFIGGTGITPLVVTFNNNSSAIAAQALLRSITFSNISDTPDTTPRTVSVSLSDGSGGTSATVTRIINVTAVNDNPVVVLSAEAVVYTENGVPIAITLSPSVSDVDSPNLNTGTLTINLNANANADDRLTIRNQGAGTGQIGVSDSNVTYEGAIIGSFSGGIGNTPLTITFNANAIPIAVQALLQNIIFSNISDAPSTANRTVSVTLTDGSGGTSSVVTKALSVSAVNDAPVITLSGSSASYTENAPGILIDSTALVSDLDNSNFNGGVLTASFTANGTADDRLTIRNQGTGTGQIGVSSNTITYQGLVIGTFSGGIGTTPLAITLNSNGTVVATQALLRNLLFSNVSDNPNTAPRTVSIALTDGSGGTSATVTQIVSLASVNDNPVVTLSSEAAVYTENGTPIAFTLSPVVSDVDSPNLNTGTLTVSFSANGTADDRLTIRNQGTGTGQIGVIGSTVTYQGVTIGTFSGGIGSTPLVITFNANATPTAVQALLQNVTFSNISDVPSTLNRTVSVTLTDGSGGTSSVVTKSIGVAAVNDAPNFTNNATLVSINEDTTSIPGATVASLFGSLFSDPDGASASLAGIVIVSNTANAATEGQWQYFWNSSWSNISTTLTNSSALFLPTTASLRFVPVTNYNGTPPSLTVRAVDNASGWTTVTSVNVLTNGGTTAISGATYSLSTSIIPVNDAPTFTKGVNQTITASSGLQTVTGWATGFNPGPANESNQTLLGYQIVSNSDPSLFAVAPAINSSGTLTYTPVASVLTNKTATIGVRVRDNGGTANAGVDTSAVQTFTITVKPQPTISINSVVQSEGNSGTTNFVFTVSLSDTSNQIIRVDFETVDGTATIADNDYTAQTGTLIFNPGETSKTIAIAVRGDTKLEANQTFGVRLRNPVNSFLSTTTNQGIGTINNDDLTPSIRIDDPSIIEGNNSIATATFTLTLSNASDSTITVNASTSNGTAIATQDYNRLSNTLVTFNPGETTKTLTVNVLGDNVNELNETLQVNLSSATNATIADSQGILTITNDDPLPGISISDLTVIEAPTGSVNATLTLTLSNPSDRTITVNWATANGTATAGQDYTSASGTVTFNPGETSKLIGINVLADNILERPPETFFVNLSGVSPTGSIADAQGQITVSEPDVVNVGTNAAPSLVNLDGDSDFDLVAGAGDGTLRYYSNTGTAANPVFTEQTETANPFNGLDVGDNSAPSFVDLDGDGDRDLVIGAADGTLRYYSNTGDVTNPIFTEQTGTANPFNGMDVGDNSVPSFTDLDGDGDQDLVIGSANGTLRYYSNTGDATTPTFTEQTGVNNPFNGIDVGDQSKPAFVDFNYDGTPDLLAGSQDGRIRYFQNFGDAIFQEQTGTNNPISGVSGSNWGSRSAPTAADMDGDGDRDIYSGNNLGDIKQFNTPLPSLSIANISTLEGNTSIQRVSVPIRLSRGFGKPVTVSYRVASAPTGSSIADGNDFDSASGIITFNPGETSKLININVRGDSTFEPDERVAIFIDRVLIDNNIVNLPITSQDSSGVAGYLSITNDDAQPGIIVSDRTLIEGRTGQTQPINFTVSLTNPSSSPITVDYNLFGGGDGINYTSSMRSGKITFNPGETQQELTGLWTVSGNDTDRNQIPTYALVLSNPSGAYVLKEKGLVVVEDEDGTPEVRMSVIKYPTERLNGLTGEYYNNADFTDLRFIRSDANFYQAFNYLQYIPEVSGENNNPSLNASDNVSIRWTGKLAPTASGEYTFYMPLTAFDTVKLWVNNQNLLDVPRTVSSGEFQSQKITLEAGKDYDIRIDYSGGQSSNYTSLFWEGPGITKQEVPTQVLYAYDSLGYAANVGYIQFKTPIPVTQAQGLWIDLPLRESINGSGGLLRGPIAIPGIDYISSQYQRVSWDSRSRGDGIIISLGESEGKFFIVANSDTVFEANPTSPTLNHDRVGVRLPSQTTFQRGWIAKYYNTADPDWNYPVHQEIVPNIDFNWGDQSPLFGTLGSDNFAIEWSGTLRPPISGFYTFYTTSNDGIEFEILDPFNGWMRLIDRLGWSDGVNYGQTQQFPLDKDKSYDMRVRYKDRSGNAQVKLEWSLAGSFAQEVIPAWAVMPMTYNNADYRWLNNTYQEQGAYIPQNGLSVVSIQDSGAYKPGFTLLDLNNQLISEKNPLLVLGTQPILKVRLNSQPLFDTQLSIEGATLNFNAQNWEQPQTIQVSTWRNIQGSILPLAYRLNAGGPDYYQSIGTGWYFYSLPVTTTLPLKVEEGKQSTIAPAPIIQLTTLGDVAEDSTRGGQFLIKLDRPAPAGGLTFRYQVEGTAMVNRDYLPTTTDTTANKPIYTQRTGTANPFNSITLAQTTRPTLGDLDADGDLDLIIGLQSGQLVSYRNTGSKINPIYVQQLGSASPVNGIVTNLVATPSLVDLNGDGKLDLVVGDYTGALRYYLNTGSTTAPAFTQQLGTLNPLSAIAISEIDASFGDLDDDGDQDMIAGGTTGSIQYFRNIGTRSNPAFVELVGAENPLNAVNPVAYSNTSLVDLDRDGKLDVVLGSSTGQLRYYRNTGTITNPVFTEQTGSNNPFNNVFVGANSNPSFGDITGDGTPDAVVGNTSGNLVYFQAQTLSLQYSINTLFIPEGQSSGTITIQPIADRKAENDQTVKVTLQGIVNTQGQLVNQGLSATYTTSLNPNIVVYRQDPNINFAWGMSSPDPALPVDNFKVVWRGKVRSRAAGQYTFITRADEGISFNLAGGTNYADFGSNNRWTVTLAANQDYEITVNYQDTYDAASAQLLWEGPGFQREIIPISQFTPLTLSSATLTIRDDDPVGVDFFSVINAVDANNQPTTLLNPRLETLQTTEGGQTQTFAVRLRSQPTANVELRFADINPLEGQFSSSSLIFTPENWNQAQTLTITGLDDDIRDGANSYQVSVQGNSADTRYNGFIKSDGSVTSEQVRALVVTNLDNETFATPTGIIPVQLDTSLPQATVRIVGSSTVTESSQSIQNVEVVLDRAAGPEGMTVYFSLGGNATASDYRVTSPRLVPQIATGQTEPLFRGPLDGLTVGQNSRPVFLDVDLDGDLDAVVGGAGNKLKFLRNVGSATNANFTLIGDTAKDNPFQTINALLPNTITQLSPTVVDIDSDGKLDLVIVNNQQTLLLRNVSLPGLPQFTQTGLTSPTGSTNSLGTHVAAADLDGNGQVELVFATSTGFVGYSTTNTNGLKLTTVSSSINSALNSINATLGNVTRNELRPTLIDWDQDGDQDIFVGQPNGTTLYYRNTGNSSSPAFTAVTTGNPFTGITTGGNAAPTFADLDGDRDLDAIIGQTNGSFAYAQNFTAVRIDPGQTSAKVPLTLFDDAIADGTKTVQVSVEYFPSSGYTFGPASEISKTLTIGDNDTPGVTISSSGTVTSEDGLTQATLSVRLNSQPIAPVIVRLGSNNSNEGRLGANRSDTQLLTFTPSNWNQVQTLQVFGVDDLVDDNNVTYQIVPTLDTQDETYRNLQPAALTFINQDNDTAKLLISSLSSTEEGRANALTVQLSTKPTAPVKVTISPSNSQIAFEGLRPGQPTTLTFDETNWNIVQAALINAVDDNRIEPIQTTELKFSSESTDRLYNNQTDSRQVTVLDNDLPMASLKVGLSAAEMSSTPGYFEVLLNNPIPENSVGLVVNYRVTNGSAISNQDYLPLTGSIRLLPGTNRGQIYVMPIDDKVTEPQENVQIELLPGIGYTLTPFLEDRKGIITIEDNDKPGIQVVQFGESTTVEEGKTTSVMVSLLSEPSSPVTITLTSPNQRQGVDQLGFGNGPTPLRSTSFTFTPNNWYALQPFYIQGIDDGFIENDNNHTALIDFKVDSTDQNYNKPGLIQPLRVQLLDRRVNTEEAANGIDAALGLLDQSFKTISVPIIGSLDKAAPKFISSFSSTLVKSIKSMKKDSSALELQAILQNALNGFQIGDTNPVVEVKVDMDREETRFVFDLGVRYTNFEISFNPEFGLPGLLPFLPSPASISAEGKLLSEFEFNLKLAMGLSRDDGFYIDTALTKLDTSINFGLSKESKLQGVLGPLQLDVFNNADRPTELKAKFELTLNDLDNRPGIAFFDVNKNGFLNAGEPFVTKQSDGVFYKEAQTGTANQFALAPEADDPVGSVGSLFNEDTERAVDERAGVDKNRNGTYDEAQNTRKEGIYRKTEDEKTYYFDANRNGVLDRSEPFTTRRANFDKPFQLKQTTALGKKVYYIDDNGDGQYQRIEQVNKSLDGNNNNILDEDITLEAEGQFIKEQGILFADTNKNNRLDIGEPYVLSRYGDFKVSEPEQAFLDLNNNGRRETIEPLILEDQDPEGKYRFLDFNNNRAYDDVEPKTVKNMDPKALPDPLLLEETKDVDGKQVTFTFMDLNNDGDRDTNEPLVVTQGSVKFIDLNINGTLDGFEPVLTNGSYRIPETKVKLIEIQDLTSKINVPKASVKQYAILPIQIDVGDRANPVFVDINNDGYIDAFVGERSGKIRFFNNQGPSQGSVFVEYLSSDNPLSQITAKNSIGTTFTDSNSAPSFFDVDGDGDRDVFIGQGDGTIAFFRNTGIATKPQFVEQTGSNNPFNSQDVGNDSFIRFGDVNGDGVTDAVIGNATGTIAFYRGSRNGTALTFTFNASSPFSNISVGSSATPTLVDLDGDAKLDLVIGAGDGTIWFYRNTGTTINPIFTAQTSSSNPFNSIDVGDRSVINFVDWGGDGDADAFISGADGLTRYFENVGSKTQPLFVERRGEKNPFWDGGRFLDINNNQTVDPGEAKAKTYSDKLAFPDTAIIKRYNTSNGQELVSDNGIFIDLNGNKIQDADDPSILIRVDQQGNSIRFVDLNADSRLNTNADGVYLEPYSFQNNTFDEAKLQAVANGAPLVKFDNDGNRLTLAEIDSFFFSKSPKFSDLLSYAFSGEANLGLKARTSVLGNAVFPALSLDINVNQPLFNLGNAAETASNKMKVEFNNITVDFGTFLTTTLKPFLKEVDRILEPIKPIIKALNTDTKLMSYLGLTSEFDVNRDGKVSVLEIARILAPLSSNPNAQKQVDQAIKYADVLLKVLDLVSTVAAFPDNENIILNMGSYTLADFQARSAKSDPKTYQSPKLDQVTTAQSPQDVSLQARKTTRSVAVLDKIKALEGFDLAILNPTNILKLLLGDPAVNLVTYDMPDMDFSFDLEKEFLLYTPPTISGLLKGSFSAKTDLAFGFDTYGINQWWQGGQKAEDILKIFDGFYVQDWDKNGRDKPEMTLSAGMSAGVSASIVVAKGTLTGGIKGEVNLDLKDVGEDVGKSDGKIRGSEIIDRISNPLDLFKLYGSIEAFLNGKFEVGADLFGVKVMKTVWSEDLGRFKLAEFSVGSDGVQGRSVFSGSGSKGYLVGALVFLDANFNGLLDEGEPTTATDDNGSFNLVLTDDQWVQFDLNQNQVIDPEEGRVVIQDGFDAATGALFTGSLSAPLDQPSGMVTPMTTLVESLARQGNLSPSEAATQIAQSLNLPEGINLLQYDSLAASSDHPDQAAAVYLAEAQIFTVLNLIQASAGGNPTDALVAQLTSGQSTNLSDPSVISEIIQSVNPDIDPQVAVGASSAIAQISEQIESLPATPDAFVQATKVLVVAQNAVEQLATATPETITQVQNQFTGESLTTQVAQAQPGNLFRPTSQDKTLLLGVDTAYVFSTADFAFADRDPESQLAKVKITGLPVFGTLTLDLNPVLKDDEISVQDIEAGKLVYEPGEDGFGGLITFRVNDGRLSAAEDSAITITNIQIAANSHGETRNIAISEATTAVTTLAAIDADNDTLTFSIAGGLDAAKFGINATTGELYFITAPDFENPTDANGDNRYIVIVSASDGNLSDNQMLIVEVTNVDDNDFAPLITSNGSDATAEIQLAENMTTVTTVTATDGDGDSLTFSIVGGDDADKFNIDELTGALTFSTAPDFENPTDANGDNRYAVIVRASDGEFIDRQTLEITIPNTNEAAPTITSDKTVSIVENTTDVVYIVTATDADGVGVMTCSIGGGADANLFEIDSSTGAIVFKASPDFEVPLDADFNNVYELIVTASDGSLSGSQLVAVTVTNTNDNASVITSNGGNTTAQTSIVENKTAVTKVVATDADGDPLTFSITGGVDMAQFKLDSETGLLSFITAPDFETPADNDGNNTYLIEIAASDGSLTRTQIMMVTVTNENDNAPVITSNGGGATTNVSILENTTAVTTVTASDADRTIPTFSITGGVDAGKFAINHSTGVLNFISAPDFEAPTDADANNIYVVEVTASDGYFNQSQTIAIAVQNLNEMNGNTSNDNLVGTNGDDWIDGGGGNDILNGGAGNDSLVGGAGNDIFNGGAGNDTLVGRDGNDILNGGTGNDSLVGGAGNDIYSVDNIGDIVIEDANAGTDTINTVFTTALIDNLANLENLTLLGTEDINGTGNTANNIIKGNTGNNILDGGDGNDIFSGDAGNDTLVGGAGNDIFNGGAGNDSLVGGDGNDILNGGTGNDSLVGGAGNDIYSVDNIGDIVIEDANAGTDTINSVFTTALIDNLANLENLTLLGTEDINGTGNTANNIIKGNTGNNILDGGDGNDIFSGDAGNDTLVGGAGNDIFSGDAGNDSLVGGDGNDILNGGTGNDSLVGGAGNDIYSVDNIGDIVIEDANAGTDTINSVFTIALIDNLANLENLTLLGTEDINGTGNIANNIIKGNTGNNILDGGAGNDILYGGAGADTLVGGEGNDSFYLGANDVYVDVVNYVFGNGLDIIYQFERAASGDRLQFSDISAIDVVKSGANTQFRITNAKAGFGKGSLLVTVSSTTDFTSVDVNVNLFGSNFFFS